MIAAVPTSVLEEFEIGVLSLNCYALLIHKYILNHLATSLSWH